jgi:hypothetical protein
MEVNKMIFYSVPDLLQQMKELWKDERYEWVSEKALHAILEKIEKEEWFGEKMWFIKE